MRAETITDNSAAAINASVRANVQPGAVLYTDAWRSYRKLKSEYDHRWIDHGIAYVEGSTHTNNLEGFRSLFRKQYHGTHHWISKKHMDAYLAEMCYRWNRRDMGADERVNALLAQVEGPADLQGVDRMTRKKRGEYEEPLGLDMDPDEALERFAQTDPAEADALAQEAGAGQFEEAEPHDTGDRLLPYVGKSGVEVSLRIGGDTFWASQAQMAEMFGISRSMVTRHLQRVFADGELDEVTTCSFYEHVGASGQTYRTKLYNLNAMISVGYRVESKQGTLFRIWATDKLVQYLTKGFAIDAPRLKQPGEADRVAELREIIRDIRAAEANVYAELKRICALCSDYDPASDAARQFYQHMQAKLYWAVVSHTPSMVLMDRADADKPNMGLQTWPKQDIRQADATVAKNYLAGAELEELNRLTTILLDIFDDQLKIGKLTLMAEADTLLDSQLKNLSRAVLTHGGSVGASQAKDHAKAEYKKFDERRRALRACERQAELLELKETAKALPKSKKK